MRLIDADALNHDIKVKRDYMDTTTAVGRGEYIALNKVLTMVDEQPTVDAVERKRGRWIRNDNSTYSCSLCQSWIPEEQHFYARYCLYCGAEMRTKEENDGEVSED